MATVQELIERLNYMVDDKVNPSTAIQLFNECQEDLSEVAGYAVEKEFSVTKGTVTFALPADIVELVEVKLKLNSKNEYKRVIPVSLVTPDDIYEDEWYFPDAFGYERFGDNIEIRPELNDDGTLKIRYYAQLPVLSATNDTPKLLPRYHRLLPLFAAARYMQNWQSEFTAKQDFYSEYLKGRAELEQETLRRKRQNRSKTVYKFRSWM